MDEKLIGVFLRFREKICVLKNQNRNLGRPVDGWYVALKEDPNIRMPDWTLTPDGQTGYTAWFYDGIIIIRVPLADAENIQEDRLREQANGKYINNHASQFGHFQGYVFHI